MKRLLIVSFSPIERDPRVRRQIAELSSRFDLTVAGYGPIDFPSVHGIALDTPAPSSARKLLLAGMLVSRQFDTYYWQQPQVRQLMASASSSSFDLFLANDVDSLPVVLRIANGKPVVVDLHEYALDESGDLKSKLLWSPLKKWVCDHSLLDVRSSMTVAPGIASAYTDAYPFLHPRVVANAPAAQELPVGSVDAGRIRLVHHGAAGPGRGIEELLQLMPLLDHRFELHLQLVENKAGYLAHLREAFPGEGRVHFHAPVPTPKICEAINCYDLGIHLLPPTSFNNQHALPNKFFEYVQARLGVVIGPSPEMAALVREHDLGIVAPSFALHDVAGSLNALTDADVRRFKDHSDRAAGVLNWSTYRAALFDCLDEALNAR